MNTNNQFIQMHAERFERHPDRHQFFFDKARAHYCSLTLQRNFGESSDQFDLRRPDIAEFGRWLRGQT